MVLDRAEDLVNGGLERGEADVNVIDLNEILGRTRLRALLEAILTQILSFLWESRVWLGLLSRFLTWDVGSSWLVSLLHA